MSCIDMWYISDCMWMRFRVSQVPQCEHAFCEACILNWLDHHRSCPVDRTDCDPCQLRPIPRIMKNLLYRLLIRCEFAEHGCSAVVTLEQLPNHQQVLWLVDCTRVKATSYAMTRLRLFFINARCLTNSVERSDWLCSWLCWLSDTNQRDRKIQIAVLRTWRYRKTHIA